MNGPALPPPRGVADADSAADRLERSILEYLKAYGPMSEREIPRSWPLTRAHVRMALAVLESEGLIQRSAQGFTVVASRK